MSHLACAQLALERGHWQQCLTECEAGLVHQPDQFSALRLLAVQAFLGLNDWVSARIELARLVLNNPGEPQIAPLVRQLLERSQGTETGEMDEALWAICQTPLSPAPWLVLAKAWDSHNRSDEAQQFLDRSIGLSLQSEPDLSAIVTYCRSSGKLDKALYASQLRALLKPLELMANLDLTYDAINVCDWRQYDPLQDLLRFHVESGSTLVGETVLASHRLDARLQLMGAHRRARLPEIENGSPFAPMAVSAVRQTGPLRVGFVGADFYQQATAYLFTGVVEAWKAYSGEMQIQAIAYDHGPCDESLLRARIEQAYDAIVPIHHLSDQEAAERILADQIDVLVLMKGIGSARMGLFARRPAPVQAFYLYYPGTSGAPYIDYFVADEVVIPPSHEHFYQETIVRLPRCYQPNDNRRAVPQSRTREEVGLPNEAFVFANFNQCYKLTPHHFRLWCSILKACPGSILWLLEPSELAKSNLRAQMVLNGVAHERLVFGPPQDTQNHLTRLGCADLLLDSYPYGAHTGASDALWAGLPVLTLMGETFASRVAASLLTSVGLPELITETPEAYCAMACAAAGGQLPLAQWRQHLQSQRHRLPLFDSVGYARDFAKLLHGIALR